MSFGENGTTHKRSAKVGYGLDKEAPPPETTRQAKYPSDADTFSTMSTITARTFFLEKELEAAIGGDRTTPNGVSSRNDSSGGGAFAWFWGNAWFGKEEERQCSALAELQEETVKTSKNLGAVADEFLGDIKTTASFLGTMMANSNYTHDCSCGAVDDSSILAGAESFVTDDPSLDDTRDSNLGGIVSQSSFHTRETSTSTASEEEEEEEGRLTDKYEF